MDRGRLDKGTKLVPCPLTYVASFPNSVWERTPAKLRFAHHDEVPTASRNRSFAGSAFPNRVWERGILRLSQCPLRCLRVCFASPLSRPPARPRRPLAGHQSQILLHQPHLL